MNGEIVYLIKKEDLLSAIIEIMPNLIEEINQIRERIYTPEDVMQYLSISNTTLYRLEKNGKIRSFNVGGSKRYRQSDIDKFIQDGLQYE